MGPRKEQRIRVRAKTASLTRDEGQEFSRNSREFSTVFLVLAKFSYIRTYITIAVVFIHPEIRQTLLGTRPSSISRAD